jgi:hypothetical protein
MAVTELTGQRATKKITSPAASTTQAYPGNVTIGDLLLVGGAHYISSGSGVDSVTASGAGAPASWTFILATQQVQPGGTPHSWLAYGVAAATGACTISCNCSSGTSYISVSQTEFQNVIAFQVDGGTSKSFSNSAADSLTVGFSNELIVGLAAWNNNITATEAGGWTLIGKIEDWSGSMPHSLIYQIGTSAGSYTPTWGLSSTVDWTAQSIAFTGDNSGSATAVNVGMLYDYVSG